MTQIEAMYYMYDACKRMPMYVQASCLATAPGEVNCTCGVGFGGDGISCYGSVAYEVFNQPSLSLLQNLIKVRRTRGVVIVRLTSFQANPINAILNLFKFTNSLIIDSRVCQPKMLD